MPVFGLAPGSYETGGVSVARSEGHVVPSRTVVASGLPRLRWPGRRVSTAFVLGGGGNRGAVQVGMLRALVERAVVPELVVGTSIGAINAAAFAGSPTIEGVYLAADVWRRIAVEEVFPRSRFHGSWRFLERREAVYPIDGLRRVVEGFLRFEFLEDSPLPLVVVASRLDDGTEEWLLRGPALESILASAALPGLYPAVEIGGTHYFDGGVLDNVALSVARAAGAKRVFVMLCGPIGQSVPEFNRPYEAMLAAFGLALRGRLRRDLALVGPDVDVVVFEEPAVAGIEPDDFSRTHELIEAGYRSARDVLDAYLSGARRGLADRARRARPGQRTV